MITTRVERCAACHGESNTMKSIQLLRGLADAGVVEAVSKLCKTSESPLIRKAAAGCLGLSGSRLAVAALSECAVNDPSPDVRLEGYLALVELGGEEVQGVLDAANKKWPEDSFFARGGRAHWGRTRVFIRRLRPWRSIGGRWRGSGSRGIWRYRIDASRALSRGQRTDLESHHRAQSELRGMAGAHGGKANHRYGHVLCH